MCCMIYFFSLLVYVFSYVYLENVSIDFKKKKLKFHIQNNNTLRKEYTLFICIQWEMDFSLKFD